MSHKSEHGQTAGTMGARAMEDMDRGAAGRNADPVPMPAEGGHSHSHAAHLDEKGSVDTTRRLPDLRQSPSPGALRQPPANLNRIGKQHRGSNHN